jgi:CHAD domain-containing protein
MVVMSTDAHTTQEVVLARIREQVEELRRREAQVRDDVPGGVHRMRVALRRLRSALATFRPVLDREVTDPLRAEMKWAADELGAARDSEVLHERLTRDVAVEPAELVLGPVARRMDVVLGDRLRKGNEQAREALGSDRYRTLVARLEALVAAPPWTDAVRRPADEILRKRMRHDWKRLRRAAAAASGEGDPERRAMLLHEVRKAAKRARYAAETLTPRYGPEATRLAKAGKKVQTVLGEHHDSVVARPVLRQLGVQAHLDGDSGFTYDLLHAREQARTDAAERRYRATWAKADRKKLRRWLR